MMGLDEHILYVASKERADLSITSLQRVWYFIVGFLILKDMEALAYKEYINSGTLFSKEGAKVTFIEDKYKNYLNTPILEEGRCISEFNKEEINTAIKKVIQHKETDLIRLQKETIVWSRKREMIESKVKELGIGTISGRKENIKLVTRIKKMIGLNKEVEDIYKDYGTYSFGDMIVIFKTNNELLY